MLTPAAISRMSSLPLDVVSKGIGVLESPDPMTRTAGEEGRRIVLIDDRRPWGWRIVNYMHYRGLRNEDQRREQNRLAQQRKRERDGQPASANVSPMSPQGEGDAEAKAETPLSLQIEEGRVDHVMDQSISIPLCDGSDYQPVSSELEEWRRLYPGIDLVAALRRMRGHWLAKPRGERKTRKGVRVSINRWLGIDQEKASRGSGTARPGKRGHRAGVDQRYKEDNAAILGGGNE